MNKVLRVIVALPGILFVVTGLRWLVDPASAAAKFGMPLNVDISEIVTSAAPEIDNAAEINTQGNEIISQSDVESMLNDFGF